MIATSNIIEYHYLLRRSNTSVSHSVRLFATSWTVALPGSSVCGILQARILEWAAIPFSRGIFPTQGSNPGLLHCRQILYHPSYQGSPSLFTNRFFRIVKTPAREVYGWMLGSLFASASRIGPG